MGDVLAQGFEWLEERGRELNPDLPSRWTVQLSIAISRAHSSHILSALFIGPEKSKQLLG